MKITQKEAYKLVAEAAPCMYRGSALSILGKLIKMTYNPKIDDPQRWMRDKGIGPVMRAGHVKERQFNKALKQLSAVLEYERHDGKIDYKLNLAPLAELNPDAEREKAEKKSKAYKTKWATEKRAEKRSRLYEGLGLMVACGVAGGLLPESILAA
jgi:hypothetical protein